MVNLLGVVIIICGFLIPYFLTLPAGRTIPPIIFFYVGFFLLFKPNKYLKISSSWAKYARIGVFMHIVSFLLLIFISLLVVNTSLSSIKFGYLLSIGMSWISKPMTQISEVLFPTEWIKMPDGSYAGTINFFRYNVTGFLDILFYIVVAICIGKWISIKQKRVQQT